MFSLVKSTVLDSILAPQYQQWMWQALLVTLSISAISIFCASVLGLLLASLRNSRSAFVRTTTVLACSLFRDTPLLLQILFWYFAAPQLLPAALMVWLNSAHEISLLGLQIGWPSFEFIAGCTALTLYSAVFIAEDIRSGIRGVARGQRDAALALGMTNTQSMRFVILPQAWRLARPALFGQYMHIVKNSSLTMAIGVAELSYASRQIETETLKAFAAYGVATLLYIAINMLINAWDAALQRRQMQVS